MSLPPRRPADWQLPDGVNRGLWDYLHDSALAEGYEAGIAASPLCAVDLAFVAGHTAPGGRVLDLGCGTGRLLRYLRRRGDRVVGVDLSGDMLCVASDKAAAEGLTSDLVVVNMTDLR